MDFENKVYTSIKKNSKYWYFIFYLYNIIRKYFMSSVKLYLEIDNLSETKSL